MADLSKHNPDSPIVKSEHILVWKMWIGYLECVFMYLALLEIQPVRALKGKHR